MALIEKELVRYGIEIGKAEAYKYAYDKLIDIIKSQRDETNTNNLK